MTLSILTSRILDCLLCEVKIKHLLRLKEMMPVSPLAGCCWHVVGAQTHIAVTIITIAVILPNIIRLQMAIFVCIIILDLFQFFKQLWVAGGQVYLLLFLC